MLTRGDLAGVRLLIMPSCYYLTEPEAEALDRWVRAGGVLLCEAHLGGYNGTTGRHARVLPGCGLAERWGIRELDSTASIHLEQSLGKDALAGELTPDVRKALEHFGASGGKFYPITLNKNVPLAGCERFAMLGGEGFTVEGTYAGDLPVIISKSIGAGRVIYCGSNVGQGAVKLPEGFRELLRRALSVAGVTPMLNSRTDEPATVRVDTIGGTTTAPAFVTIYNRSDKNQAVHLSGSGRFTGVYSGKTLDLTADSPLTLPPKFTDLFVRQ